MHLLTELGQRMVKAITPNAVSALTVALYTATQHNATPLHTVFPREMLTQA